MAPDWLASTTWAIPALDIITIWLALPTATVLYLAALQRIPDSLIEAAMLDGAGPLRRVRYIIWPGVRYMTLLVAIVALLAFTNGSFDLVNILTRGQPIYATQTLIYYIYYTAFTNGEFGYAAALSVLQIVHDRRHPAAWAATAHEAGQAMTTLKAVSSSFANPGGHARRADHVRLR